MGHIRTSVGRETIEIPGDGIKTSELIEMVRELSRSNPTPGFTKFNTLVVVNSGDAFTGATRDRVLHDGDEVVLLPFSHGG